METPIGRAMRERREAEKSAEGRRPIAGPYKPALVLDFRPREAYFSGQPMLTALTVAVPNLAKHVPITLGPVGHIIDSKMVCFEDWTDNRRPIGPHMLLVGMEEFLLKNLPLMNRLCARNITVVTVRARVVTVSPRDPTPVSVKALLSEWREGKSDPLLACNLFPEYFEIQLHRTLDWTPICKERTS